jgi:small subunit ribosomal protein S17
MTTNNRRRMTGLVTRAKATKTVSVRVDRSYRHRLYGKVVHTSKQYMVHDELGCGAGDEVMIVESRPLSKRKRWVVEQIIRKASEEQVEAITAVQVDMPTPEAQG